MADPVRVQVVQAGLDAGRPGQLPAVRDQEQPGPFGDAERGRELVRGPPPLVVGQAEPGHPAPRVLGRQPGQGPGLQRVLGPVGRHDHADADPGGRRGGRGRVEDQLDHVGDAAEPPGVPGRVDLDLQPARPVRPFVLRGLGQQPAHVAGPAQHRARGVV